MRWIYRKSIEYVSAPFVLVDKIFSVIMKNKVMGVQFTALGNYLLSLSHCLVKHARADLLLKIIPASTMSNK